MKKATLVIHDEINITFSGIAYSDIEDIIEKTKIFIPAARHTAAYKMKMWDGRESQFNSDGSTKFFMLDKVLPILESKNYDISIVDNRKTVEFQPAKIDEMFLHEYGVGLRYYQVESVNTIINNEKGILELPTSAGKTVITGAIAKVYDPSYRSIVIVPSENLVTQTYNDISKYDLDVGKITGKITGKKRDEMWKKRHLVITWQTLNRNREHLKNYEVVIWDECHDAGDVMFDLLTNDFDNAHIRVGLTGTVPDDKHKTEKIKAHIGGDILYKVEPKDLMEQDFISTVDIELIPVQHLIDLPSKNELDWEVESKYLNKNKDRITAIADKIRQLKKTHDGNFLVLSFPEIGKVLSKELDSDFIDKDVDTSVRESYYKKYDTIDNYDLVATYRTVGTGISINNIQYVVLIDVGKNKTRILQSIGRGLRKDGMENHLKVFDIYAELMEEYSTKSGDTNTRVYGFSARTHLKQRIAIYKHAKYTYNFTASPIIV